MTSEVKITLIIATTLLLLLGGLMASCNYQHQLDAAAPIVETCIKHPATQRPWERGNSL